MKRNLHTIKIGQLLLIATFSCFMFSTNAQNAISNDSKAEASPVFQADAENYSTAAKNAGLWDQEFLYNINGQTGAAGQAGAIWTGSEFWVSRWATDSVFSFDINGLLLSRFVIPSLSGIRGFTKDNNGDVWAGNATGQIFRINPATKTIASTVNIPAGVTARFITFDPTADGGAGGFYVGNFNTDITLISKTGALLSSIPAGTHGLGGMYGAAFDGVSPGGPFLWIFSQPANPGALITQLQLPVGLPTAIAFDVNADLGQTGLAGGLFIDGSVVPGKWIIGGILQGGDDLFGYDLGVSVSVNELDKNNLDIQLYPNPSDGVFTVDVKWESNDNIDVLIYDMNGKVVFQDKAVNTNSYKKEVNLSEKASGNYMLKVINAQGPSVMPFTMK